MAKPATAPLANFASDATWTSPGDSWDGTATKVSPAALQTTGTVPGSRWAANHFNWLTDVAMRWLTWIDGVLDGTEAITPTTGPVQVAGLGLTVETGDFHVLSGVTPTITPALKDGVRTTGLDADITLDPADYATVVVAPTGISADRVYTLPSYSAYANRSITILNLHTVYTITVQTVAFGGPVVLRRVEGEPYAVRLRATYVGWAVEAMYYRPGKIIVANGEAVTVESGGEVRYESGSDAVFKSGADVTIEPGGDLNLQGDVNGYATGAMKCTAGFHNAVGVTTGPDSDLSLALQTHGPTVICPAVTSTRTYTLPTTGIVTGTRLEFLSTSTSGSPVIVTDGTTSVFVQNSTTSGVCRYLVCVYDGSNWAFGRGHVNP